MGEKFYHVALELSREKLKKFFSVFHFPKAQKCDSIYLSDKNLTKGQKMTTPSYEQCANVMAEVCYGVEMDARTMRDFAIYFWNDCKAAHIDPESEAGSIIAHSIRNGYLRGLEA